jgi:hypothetical protein
MGLSAHEGKPAICYIEISQEEAMEDKAEGAKVAGQGQPRHSPYTGGRYYQIRIQGQLSIDWADWLDGLEMTCLENGEMALTGIVPDQAALMGVLAKLHRLNLTILSVNELDRGNQVK